MLELRNISRYYKQKKGPTVKALDGVNLTFNERGMIFVLGKSGSGKSTLLNVIGGLDKYTDGDLLIKGKSTKTFSQSEFDSYRNTMVGFIFQEYNVLDEFTVGQNIGIALELQGKKATSEAINDILKLLDMQGYANRKPNTLSGGQKQRVAIARALVKNPEIIMADEPTGALDSVTGRQLFETLKKLSEEKLVIIVTHDQEFAETYGDRIIEFSDGKIIRDVSRTESEKVDQAKIFTEQGITLKAGYQLTAEDLEQINRYLQSNTDKTFIKVLNEAYDFKDTPEIKPIPQTDKLPLIKSKMPFLSTLKMGASALKHRTIRLVLSIILASTAFVMFGLTDTIASFNQKDTAVSTMQKAEIKTSVVEKRRREKFETYQFDRELRLTKEDIVALNNVAPGIQATPLTFQFSIFLNPHFGNHEEWQKNRIFAAAPLAGTVSVAPAKLSGFDLKMHSGTLPSLETEVALPEFIAMYFKDHGYRTNATQQAETINSYNDLIGKKLGEYTVTGVVDTNLDLTPFNELRDNNEPRDLWTLQNKLRNYLQSGFHNTYFVSNEFFSRFDNVTPAYLMSDYAYPYNYEIVNSEEGEFQETISSFLSLKALENNEKTYFLFDESKSITTLSENEIIFDGNNLRSLKPEITDVIENSVSAIKSEFITSDANDMAIEAYLKDYYYRYPEFQSEGDVAAHSTWTNAQKNKYRTYYADALFNPLILYKDNIYQPTKYGEKLLVDKLKVEIPASIDPLTLKLSRQSKDGVINYPEFKIVGMDFDYNEYLQMPGFIYYNNIMYISDEAAATLDLIVDGVYESAIVYHGLDRASLNKLLNLEYKVNNEFVGDYFIFKNEVLNTVSSVAFVLEMMRSVFTVIGAIFAVFAALLLINFITLSVSFKKQEIGILRAIGARGFDVAGIFMNEAGIIAAINYVLAVAGTIIATILINQRFSSQLGSEIVILIFGVRQFILLLVIAFGIAALSSFIPVIRLSRKKPIDAIRGR